MTRRIITAVRSKKRALVPLSLSVLALGCVAAILIIEPRSPPLVLEFTPTSGPRAGERIRLKCSPGAGYEACLNKAGADFCRPYRFQVTGPITLDDRGEPSINYRCTRKVDASDVL